MFIPVTWIFLTNPASKPVSPEPSLRYENAILYVPTSKSTVTVAKDRFSYCVTDPLPPILVDVPPIVAFVSTFVIV